MAFLPQKHNEIMIKNLQRLSRICQEIDYRNVLKIGTPKVLGHVLNS